MTKQTNIKNKSVLQLCHDYKTPFLDVARQYVSLFKDTQYQVVTVFLKGKSDQAIALQTGSHQVIFLENSTKDLRGLKRKQIRQLQTICGQFDFEFALAHRYKALFILCHIKDLRVLGIHHAYGDYERFTRRWFVQRHKKELSLIGVSDAIRDDIRQSLPRFPTQQIQTLYNRINLQQVTAKQLNRFDARDELGLSQNKFLFVNVGRLHPDKDQKTLIKAFALAAPEMSNAILLIIGTGRLEKNLKKLVADLGMQQRIIFPGFVSDAANYLRAFDCFVLSSDHEPFGMVLLEAIAAELPVIASNAGGAREIIRDKQCLFEVGDEKKLAEIMHSQYALNNSQKTTLNKHNMQFAEQNFTDEAVKKTFWQLAFFQSLSEPV